MCVVGYFDQSIIEDENQAMGRVRTALENRDGDKEVELEVCMATLASAGPGHFIP